MTQPRLKKSSGGGRAQREAKSRGRPAAYDWRAIRREYIRGEDGVTLELLSAKTGYPALDTLKKRSGAEDWADLRREFRHQTGTKIQEIDLDLKAEIQGRHAKVGKDLIALAVSALAYQNPQKLKPIDAVRLVQIGTDIERKALGLEEVQVRAGRLKSLSDLDKLSEAELWKLAGMLPPEDDADPGAA